MSIHLSDHHKKLMEAGSDRKENRMIEVQGEREREAAERGAK